MIGIQSGEWLHGHRGGAVNWVSNSILNGETDSESGENARTLRKRGREGRRQFKFYDKKV